jgi:3-dehydroquinate synthetase
MTAAGLDRQSFVIGLGGGVVATFPDLSRLFSIVEFLTQIPTTLLAMVDSSIGGKTG